MWSDTRHNATFSMFLICLHCSVPVTNKLRIISHADTCQEMGENYLQLGTIVEEDGSFVRNRKGCYIVNSGDVIHAHLTSDSTRIQGCCGLDGCDGPNLRCNGCNSYLATQMSDCWMAHCVVFETETTRPIWE